MTFENMLFPITANMKKRRIINPPTFRTLGKIIIKESVRIIRFLETLINLKTLKILSIFNTFKNLKNSDSRSI